MGLCPRALQLKQMEVQLEEEYEDKQKVLREKRELESKLAMLSDQVSVACWRGPGQQPVPSGLKEAISGIQSWEWGGGLGSVKPTIIACITGVITTHSTPRLFSLAGTTLALPLLLLVKGTLRMRARVNQGLREDRRRLCGGTQSPSFWCPPR